jgi:hypothetical protein
LIKLLEDVKRFLEQRFQPKAADWRAWGPKYWSDKDGPINHSFGFGYYLPPWSKGEEWAFGIDFPLSKQKPIHWYVRHNWTVAKRPIARILSERKLDATMFAEAIAREIGA